jgi:phosphate:Na+ symporter
LIDLKYLLVLKYYIREQIDLAKYAVPGLKGLLVYTLAGLLITIVMQSSNAMMVIIITALSLHQVSYENAIALAIGANMGTTVTGLLGSLSANYLGKQLAVTHFLFNFVTGILVIFGIHYMTDFVNVVSNSLGIDKENYTLKLAVFHTSFNLLGIFVFTPFIKYFVAFLEKVIKPTQRHLSEPIYLSESSLEYPETFLQSIHNETIHLYNNISKLLMASLQLDRSILESDNLKKDIKNSHQVIENSFDLRYKENIKPLIAAILEYSGRGQNLLSKKEKEKAFKLRLASMKLAEGVKAIDGLRKNMKKHFNSENKAVRNEYNKMRLLIISVLRELDSLDIESTYDSSIFVSLEDIRVQIKKYRKETNARLDQLIREDEIDPVLASSILNDRTFTRDAAKRLLDAGQILFSTQNETMKMAEEMIELSEEEVDEIANSETDCERR